MKNYNAPELRTVVFYTDDVITVSPGGGIVLPPDMFSSKKNDKAVDVDELFN